MANRLRERIRITIPKIVKKDIPASFEPELGLAEVLSVLPHGKRELLIHAVGRTNTKPVRWAGLFKVPHYMTVDHFGILPGKQFPEILSQAGIVGLVLQHGWTGIRMVLATEMSWKVAPIPEGMKAVQVKANDVVMVIIDQLLCDEMSARDSTSRRVVTELHGRIFVGDRHIANTKAFGEGIVNADKWVNVISKI